MSSSSSTASGASISIGRASRSTSVTYHTTRSGQSEDLDKRLEELELRVKKDALLAVASELKGKPATIGKRIVGGFNLLLEIVFEDQTSWFARIPKPWRSSHPEKTMHSEVSAFRYLKRNTKLPVPEVYKYEFIGDQENKVGVTYMLVEKMPGRMVPQLGMEDEDFIKARRFHEQLTNVIVELATVKFDTIGSLQESRTDPGTFTVEPLYDFYTTYPLSRGKTEFNRGPYETISEYFTAVADLNHRTTKFGYRPTSASSRPLDEELARLHLIKKMIPTFADNSEYNAGPFVMQDWDLTSQNILVDDDCNITAILDVNGVIGPLPNLGRYPDLIYETTMSGPIFDQKLFKEIFTSHEVSDRLKSSPLAEISVRENLLKTAHKVWMFEHTLMYPAHKNLNLYGKGGLYEFVYGDENFSEKDAFDKIGKTDIEFQSSVPRSRSNSQVLSVNNGRGKGSSLGVPKYSWEEKEEIDTKSYKSFKSIKSNRSMHSSRSGAVSRRISIRESIYNTPIARKRREENHIREYVRQHHHLPPNVEAQPFEKRINGPEKFLSMAWRFITCR